MENLQTSKTVLDPSRTTWLVSGAENDGVINENFGSDDVEDGIIEFLESGNDCTAKRQKLVASPAIFVAFTV